MAETLATLLEKGNLIAVRLLTVGMASIAVGSGVLIYATQDLEQREAKAIASIEGTKVSLSKQFQTEKEALIAAHSAEIRSQSGTVLPVSRAIQPIEIQIVGDTGTLIYTDGAGKRREAASVALVGLPKPVEGLDSGKWQVIAEDRAATIERLRQQLALEKTSKNEGSAGKAGSNAAIRDQENLNADIKRLNKKIVSLEATIEAKELELRNSARDLVNARNRINGLRDQSMKIEQLEADNASLLKRLNSLGGSNEGAVGTAQEGWIVLGILRGPNLVNAAIGAGETPLKDLAGKKYELLINAQPGAKPGERGERTLKKGTKVAVLKVVLEGIQVYGLISW